MKALGTVGNLGYSLEDMYSGASELYNTYILPEVTIIGKKKQKNGGYLNKLLTKPNH